MANFSQRPGSSGQWSDADFALTLRLGETGELILWGGGPPGKEKLAIGSAPPGSLTLREDTKPGSGPQERLIKLTPLALGESSVHARVGSISGPDYAKPVKVAVLPRKPSSIGPEHVIVYSGHGTETIQEAYNKLRGSAPDALVYGGNNSGDFIDLLTKYRDTGRRISQLEFNTHGSPGFISLGDDRLGAAFLRGLAGKGLHAALAAGASVFFHGCNVAEGKQGNEFLVAFAETLLRGGGSVGASTSLGFGTGNWGNGKVYHFLGSTKKVYVDQGGVISQKVNFDD